MRRTDFARPARRALLAVAALAALAPGPGGAVRAQGVGAPETWLVSFEAVPAIGLPEAARGASFAKKRALLAQSLATYRPEILRALGIAPARVGHWTGAGGYKAEVSPSATLQWSGDEAGARRLAAAFGLVHTQWSVLVWRYGVPAGAPGAVGAFAIAFPAGLDPQRHEAALFRGLGARLASDKLGFTRLGRRMIFLNIGTGIDDAAYAAGLGATVAAGPPGLAVLPARRAIAIFVENDWAKARVGEEYERALGGPDSAAVAALRALRARYGEAVARWAAAP
jgi:hypothetical protein